MSIFSSGKQVLSNFGEDLKEYFTDRLVNGVKNDPLLKKAAEIKQDVEDGKYIFGDGEGLLHNYGEALGKFWGTAGEKIAEGVNEFGNGFFGTDVGQDISKAANDVYNKGKELLSDKKAVIHDGLTNSAGSAGGAGSAGVAGTAQANSFGNFAPGASLFGMDRETAYQEYMANTAHQREVADLRAAGLNPVLGISGSGASVVSGNAAGASSGKKGIDGNALVDVIGATAGLVTTLISKNPSLGYMVSNVVGKAGDVFDS